MTELVMCRRVLGGRQARRVRIWWTLPLLPSAQPPEPIPVACAHLEGFQRRCSVGLPSSIVLPSVALVHTLLTTAPASTP